MTGAGAEEGDGGRVFGSDHHGGMSAGAEVAGAGAEGGQGFGNCVDHAGTSAGAEEVAGAGAEGGQVG